MGNFPSNTNEGRGSMIAAGIAAYAIIALIGARLSVAADDSLARYAPADVGLYVECVNAADLLIPLTDSQIWVTLADLAGQPARAEETLSWRERIRQTVAMQPDEAIRTLLARRAAFVGDAPGRSQDGVVLCLPATGVNPGDLIAQWSAQPRSDGQRVKAFRLKNMVGASVIDGRTLCFGDSGPAGRLLSRVEDGVERGRAALADDVLFRSLLARVPETPDGVLFVRLPRPAPATASAPAAATAPSSAPARSPASQAASGVAAAFRDAGSLIEGASGVLVALHRDKNLLHFSAVSDARPTREPEISRDLSAVVKSLPEGTLLAWCGEVDFPRIVAQAAKLPPNNLLRMILGAQKHGRGVRRLIDAMGTSACLAVGPTSPPGRRDDAPPVPAIGVILPGGRPEEANAALGELIGMAAAAYNLMALSAGAEMPRLGEIQEIELGGRTARSLDLTPVIEPFDTLKAIGRVEVCWAADERGLVAATHRDWLRKLIAARAGDEADLSAALHVTQHALSPRASFVVAVQSGALSDAGAAWLRFLDQHAPDALTESWWRDRQPGGGEPRLGINGNGDGAASRLIVESVEPLGRSAGLILPGDKIVGCDRRRFATSQPVAEFRQAIAARPNARWVDVLVDRAGVTLERRIPLPFVNPVELLRRVTALGRIAQRVVVHDDAGADGHPRGYMTVELRPSPAPASSSGDVSAPAGSPGTSSRPAAAAGG